jgi:hypothetical protein
MSLRAVCRRHRDRRYMCGQIPNPLIVDFVCPPRVYEAIDSATMFRR